MALLAFYGGLLIGFAAGLFLMAWIFPAPTPKSARMHPRDSEKRPPMPNSSHLPWSGIPDTCLKIGECSHLDYPSGRCTNANSPESGNLCPWRGLPEKEPQP